MLNLLNITSSNLGLSKKGSEVCVENNPTSLITQKDSILTLKKIDLALDIINCEHTNVMTTINELRSSEKIINSNLNTNLINLVKILNKITEYCKSKGEFYYCNSEKKIFLNG